MMQNLMQYEPAILLMGASMCLFMALYFFVDNKNKKSPKGFLAGFMLVYGLTFIDSFMETSGFLYKYPNLTGVLLPTFFLLGPFIYFYIRDMCDTRAYILDKKRYKHFILPVLSILLMATYYAFPEELKLSLLVKEDDIPESGFFIIGILGAVLTQILLPVQILYYLIKSYGILRQYFSTLKQFFANIDDHRMDWLRLLILMLSVQWILYAIKEWMGWPGQWADAINFSTNFIDVGIIYFLSFKGLRQAAILQDELANNQALEPKESDGKTRQKYAKSALSNEDSERILGKLHKALETDALYNDSMLSLRSLSDHTKISTNYISQVINQKLNCNFFDFVNKFRIEAAMKQLTNKERKIPVLEIAHNVGFNSKSTFNTAFKRHTGLTPTEYRKQQ
ncbi:MAG: AraC family transcriptional regulator [Alphaproteobacteria bacterium]|nr:AraC family transcriptional regulator [Alphaproteobacteria bacterium]